MLWSYFTACLNGCSSTFSANQAIFGKVYFPRLVAPIATCAYRKQSQKLPKSEKDLALKHMADYLARNPDTEVSK